MGAAGTDSKPAPVLPILIAMVAGALAGWLVGPEGAIGTVKLVPIFDLIGALFINLLKMLIVPLILVPVIGAADEWHQSFIVGRDASFWDWMADEIGVVFATYLYFRWAEKRDGRNA